MRRRANHVIINFDGLTDSVTNLVGVLILLVFLIVAVTHEPIVQGSAPPPETAAGEFSPDDLQRELNNIHAALQQERELGSELEEQIKQLEEEIALLAAKDNTADSDSQRSEEPMP